MWLAYLIWVNIFIDIALLSLILHVLFYHTYMHCTITFCNHDTCFAYNIYPCIQAFLEHPSQPGKYSVVLEPVCSVPVYDAKAKKELAIMDMSDNTSPVEGGRKIILLCEKITREDIKVHTH